MTVDARNAGLHEAVMVAAEDQVRLVKARLLLSTHPQDVQAVHEYSGVQSAEFAAMLLAATDGDVEKCKAEILRFWTDREYYGPILFDTTALPALLDTI